MNYNKREAVEREADSNYVQRLKPEIMLNQIKKYLQSNQTTNLESTCPNCWGRQEYQGAFNDAIKKEEITLNNIDQKKGWIEAYAAKNLLGIKLQKKGNKIVCPSCNLSKL